MTSHMTLSSASANFDLKKELKTHLIKILDYSLLVTDSIGHFCLCEEWLGIVLS